MIDIKPYCIAPGSPLDLRDRSTREDVGLSKKEGKKALKKLSKRLTHLQELLYARRARGLLVIFQAMDADGKDSTTRRVFLASWFRDLVVMQTVVDKLQSLQMSYPEPEFDPAAIEIV